MKYLLLTLLLILSGCAKTAKVENDLRNLQELETEIAQNVIKNNVRIDALEIELNQHRMRFNDNMKAMEYLYQLIVTNAALIINFHDPESE